MDTCPWIEEEEKMEKAVGVTGNRDIMPISDKKKGQKVNESSVADANSIKSEVSSQTMSTDDSVRPPTDLEDFINSDHRRQMKEACNSISLPFSPFLFVIISISFLTFVFYLNDFMA